jgi:hypothetical protein
MARAPSEEPQGLVYRPELISAVEERELLNELQSLRWDPIVLHGRTARRTGRHFGLDYDYQARAPRPGDAVPDWLLPARERAAHLAGHEPKNSSRSWSSDIQRADDTPRGVLVRTASGIRAVVVGRMASVRDLRVAPRPHASMALGSAILRATIAASSPTPMSSDDLRLRRK